MGKKALVYIEDIIKGSYLVWQDSDENIGTRSGYVKSITLRVFNKKIVPTVVVKLDKDCRLPGEKYEIFDLSPKIIKNINLKIH